MQNKIKLHKERQSSLHKILKQAEQEKATDYSALDTIEDRKDEGMDKHAGT